MKSEMPSVAIIDYGLCNLGSIRRAIEICGARVLIASHPDEISNASHIVLPGVGSFPQAVQNLKLNGMLSVLQELAGKGLPLLGICLGMQLLASDSLEDGHTQGLGLIPGSVKLLVPDRPQERVPHIGWNSVIFGNKDDPLLNSLPSGSNFYFVSQLSFCTA